MVKSIVKQLGLYSVTWDILKGQKPRRRCIWRYIINADSFRTEQFQGLWKVGICLVLQGTFIQGFQMLFLLDYSYAVAFSAGKGGGLIRHCHISMYLLIWWFDHYVQELNRARKGGGSMGPSPCLGAVWTILHAITGPIGNETVPCAGSVQCEWVINPGTTFKLTVQNIIYLNTNV